MDLDGVTISCPRCREAMDSFTKREAGAEATADMCLRCGGLWLDGAEVRRLHPAIAAAIPGAASHQAKAAKPILVCPRCGELPSPIFFFELELDVCTACKGVWIDGDELTDLARSDDRLQGLPAPEAGSYRDNAADALRWGRVTCTGCGDEQDLDSVEPTSRGPLCRECAAKYREGLFEKELAEYEVPKRPLVELPSFEDVSRGLRAAGALLSAALVASAPRCPDCGCHRYSRCRH
jgi:Zn-finger nucleic acid-binding protein